jgi:ABC-type glycerol-3-phosphate transport system permease component
VKPGRAIVWLLMLALAVTSAAPVLWIALTSFKTGVEAQAVPPVMPSHLDFGTYVGFFEGRGPRGAAGPDALWHSLIIATGATMLTMAVAIPAAYALARYRIRRKADIQFWIISSRMMPLIAGIVPLSIMFTWLGLDDTLQGMMIVYAGFNLSFAVWLLTIFFSNVPTEIEESARIDGLSRLSTLWRMTLPLARSGVGVIAIFTWIFSWNEFLGGIVLTTHDALTLPVFLSATHSPVVMMIQIVPAVLITFFLQRHIVSGLSMGAVTGE